MMSGHSTRWNKQTAGVHTLAAQIAKSSLSSNGNNAKDNVNLRISSSREFEFIQFFYTVRNIPNRLCKTASKFEKEILNTPSYSSRSLKYSECGFFTHAYTAILLVAVAVEVCLILPPITE